RHKREGSPERNLRFAPTYGRRRQPALPRARGWRKRLQPAAPAADKLRRTCGLRCRAARAAYVPNLPTLYARRRQHVGLSGVERTRAPAANAGGFGGSFEGPFATTAR